LKRINYTVSLKFGRLLINEVIIDQHYKEKHKEINDLIILHLVKKINSKKVKIAGTKDNYRYYVAQPVYYKQKPYRLIFTIENGYNYIGVINAFRVKEKKYGISI